MKIALLSRFDADSPVFYVSYESLKVVFVHVLSAKHEQQPLKVSCLLATTFPNNGFLKKTFFFLELSVQLSFLPLLLLTAAAVIHGQWLYAPLLCCRWNHKNEDREALQGSGAQKKNDPISLERGSSWFSDRKWGRLSSWWHACTSICMSFFFFVTVTTEVSVSVCQWRLASPKPTDCCVHV